MGLDMYLRATTYVSNYDFRPADKPVNKAIKEALGLGHLDADDASVEVSITVGYWRKANQIHKWFVDNCQDGVDECQKAWVSRGQLEELLKLCKETQETKNAELLPPESGFFFGSTEIDEWYWTDIEETIKMLEGLLNDEALKDFDFEYQSSW